MEILINNEWRFKLLEVGGEAIDTASHGSYPLFTSYLVIGLMTEPQDMTELYNLLSSLTANHFHGMIVSVSERNAVALTSWKVLKLEENETGVLYSCTVGYQAWMPKDKINYKFKIGS